MEKGEYDLKCNHGSQKGPICECDDGWMSSGIHKDNALNFNWCDKMIVDNAASLQMEPRRLSKGVEILLIIVSLYIPG